MQAVGEPKAKSVRRVLVRRHRVAVPAKPASRGESAKKVLVARRIRPGQTLKLHGERGGTVTMPQDLTMVKSLPETIVFRDEPDKTQHPELLVDKDGRPQREDAVSQLTLYLAHLKEIEVAKAAEEDLRQQYLSSMLCGEQLLATREGRILERWQKANKQWDKTRKIISRRIDVGVDELAMDKGYEFREKMEAFQLLNTATPLEKKMTSPSCWKMTLRGETTTFVQVGNIFSGLFCEIKNSQPSIMETIRRPSKKASTDSSCSWRASAAYQQRRYELRKRIAVIHPHEISDASALEIVGQDLFDLRHIFPEYSIRPPLPGSDVVEQIQDETATSHPVVEDQKPVVPLIVNVEASTSLMLFNVSAGDDSADVVMHLHNSGTSAVHCQWGFDPVPDPVKSLISKSTRVFWWSDTEFTMLPAEKKAICFRYVPNQVGISLESVTLSMFPGPTNGGFPTVRLRGIKRSPQQCLISLTKSYRRTVQGEEHRLRMRSLILNIVESVHSAEIPVETRPAKFYTRNRRHGIWYSPDLFSKFIDLANDMYSALPRRIRLSLAWDYDVASLYSILELVSSLGHPNIEEFRFRLETLVSESKIKPSPDAEMYKHVHKKLTNLALAMPLLSIRSQIAVDSETACLRRKEKALEQEKANALAKEVEQQAKSKTKVKTVETKPIVESLETVLAPVQDPEQTRKRRQQILETFTKLASSTLMSEFKSCDKPDSSSESFFKAILWRDPTDVHDFGFMARALASGEDSIMVTASMQLLRIQDRQLMVQFDSCPLTDIHVDSNGDSLAIIDGDVMSWNKTTGAYAMEMANNHAAQVCRFGPLNIARDALGQIWTWSTSNPVPVQRSIAKDPVVVTGVVDIAGGSKRFLALESSGRILYMSSPSAEVLAVGLPNNEKAVAISTCGNSSLVLSGSGTVYSWRNENARLPAVVGGIEVAEVPSPIDHFIGKRVVKIAAGFDKNLALLDTGELYQWGRPNSEDQSLIEIKVPSDVRIVMLHSSPDFGFALVK
uniref:Uncharacterized protein n=1 Tax=Spongospora subterranea TaxID=70186 RepID=A0A0H5QN41_9EUKA|eukprot:CRZ03418.1 hypothetical protein [Spongospora subterranea]